MASYSGVFGGCSGHGHEVRYVHAHCQLHGPPSHHRNRNCVKKKERKKVTLQLTTDRYHRTKIKRQ